MATENTTSNEQIKTALEFQYGRAQIKVLNEKLPSSETIFFRQVVEDLIRRLDKLEDGDVLDLDGVHLDTDLKPIAMHWKLRAHSEQAKSLESEGINVSYLYLTAGVHDSNLEFTETTSVFRSDDRIEDGETVFAVVVTEYDKKLASWLES